MSDLRTAAQQALDSINELFAAEQSEGGERGGHIRTPATREHLVRVAQARRALHESCDTLRAALAQEQTEPNISRCPQCNGPADNGFDRSIPPNPYLCTKCIAEPVEPVAAAVVATQSDVWRGYNGQWAPPGKPIKMVQMLRDLPMGTLLYTAPPKAEPVEPVEPVAWMFESERNFNLVGYGGWEKRITECRPNALQSSVRNVTPLYTAPPQRLPLTDEEILKAIGWERAEMYMKLATNFPVDEAKQETLKNARAVERAVWEKNHG